MDYQIFEKEPHKTSFFISIKLKMSSLARTSIPGQRRRTREVKDTNPCNDIGMRQYKDTCFFNSVLNSFFISSYGRQLLFNAYLNYCAKQGILNNENPENKRKFFQAIEKLVLPLQVCSTSSDKEARKLDFFAYIAIIMCNRNIYQVSANTIDVLKSKIANEKASSDFVQLETGGFALNKTIEVLSFLEVLEINDISGISNGTKGTLTHEQKLLEMIKYNSVNFAEMDDETLRIYNNSIRHSLKLDFEGYTGVPKCLILYNLYQNDNPRIKAIGDDIIVVLNKEQEINTKIEIRKGADKYVLNHAVLEIYIESANSNKNSNMASGHVVSCSICRESNANGVGLIYDSNKDEKDVLMIDWRNIDIFNEANAVLKGESDDKLVYKDEVNRLLKYLNYEGITKVKFLYLFYVDEDYVSKLQQVPKGCIKSYQRKNIATEIIDYANNYITSDTSISKNRQEEFRIKNDTSDIYRIFIYNFELLDNILFQGDSTELKIGKNIIFSKVVFNEQDKLKFSTPQKQDASGERTVLILCNEDNVMKDDKLVDLNLASAIEKIEEQIIRDTKKTVLFLIITYKYNPQDPNVLQYSRVISTREKQNILGKIGKFFK